MCMPWVYTNISNTIAVTIRPKILGSCPDLKKVSARFPCVAEWITKGRMPTGPSWAGTGLNMLHKMPWATPAIIKRLIPDPKPQPFCTISSRNITIMLAPTSCPTRIGTNNGLATRWPYTLVPYSVPSAIMTMIVTIFVAEVNKDLSSGFLKLSLTSSEPFNSCISSPAVTMGPIPSSNNVPCWAANITLANARKSNFGSLVTP